MNRWTIISTVLAVALTSSIGACKTRDVPDDAFRVLFRGYTLSRTGAVSADTSLTDGDVPDLHDPIVPGVTLTPGQGYVFRKDNGWPNEAIGVALLPERLQRIGARVVKAPPSPKHMIYALINGPFFRIEFEKNGHAGAIFNRNARHETEGPVGSEVLVVIYR